MIDTWPSQSNYRVYFFLNISCLRKDLFFNSFADDPLWDGQNCNGPESTCCTNPNMPWFLKTLDETTTDDIELRVCSNAGLPNEDTPLDIIEIYVK